MNFAIPQRFIWDYTFKSRTFYLVSLIMLHFFKKALFTVYVFWVRRFGNTSGGEKEPPPAVFIWKDAWFFFWHRFFWSWGRTVLVVFNQARPLLGDEIDEHSLRRYEEFTELARRDFAALSFQNKLMKPTRYKLAPDTARALCLFYGCIADVAPWQYGVPARVKAVRRIRALFLVALLLFAGVCMTYVEASSFSAWSAFTLFNALMLLGVGWYADSSLCRIAREAERIRSKNKHPQ